MLPMRMQTPDPVDNTWFQLHTAYRQLFNYRQKKFFTRLLRK
jgi:hypothetical protein